MWKVFIDIGFGFGLDFIGSSAASVFPSDPCCSGLGFAAVASSFSFGFSS